MRNTGAQSIWRVRVSRAELLKFTRWNAASKEFIQASGETIDLQDATRAYRVKVEAFHGWFEQQQKQIHRAEFGYLEEVKVKLQQLDARTASVDQPEVPERDELLANDQPLTDDDIRPIAFQIYLEDRCRQGREKEHWEAAVGRIQERRAVGA